VEIVFIAARSSKGRTAAFEAAYLGSIPSLAAMNGNTKHLFCASYSLLSRIAAFEAAYLGLIYVAILYSQKVVKQMFVCFIIMVWKKQGLTIKNF
jgi:hypothetical protein